MDKKNTQLAAVAKRAINKLINYSVDGYTFTGLNSAQNANAWSVVAVAAHCQVEPSAKKQKMNLKQGILLNCRWELLQHQPNIVHLQWALTLSYASMATSDPEFFQRAEEYWKIVAETSLLNCGYIGHQKDDMSYHESDLCGGVSSDPLTVGSFETVIFMTLSSLLAHSMNGDQYKKAAILSANCVRDYMMDSVTSLVKGFALEIQSGQTLWDDGVSCFLTGILLEGLSALAIVTGEPSWSAWARDVADAVMNLGDWHTTNGILYTWSKNIHFRTFRGDALQDAEKWKRDFVVATSSLSDEAAARAFLTKIAPDSPASTYIDTLPHNTKTSWLRLERAFRAHWTSTRRSDTSNTKSYDAFEIHVLTKEVVFDLAKRLDDVSASDGIDIWADDHLRLGRATGWPDEALIRMTRFLIPAFVQAILSLAPKPATFADMCMAVKQLPRGLLELERDRCYENEKKEERLSTIEQKLEAISEKMDKILNGGIVTQGASSTGGRVPVLDRNQTTSK
ncbi:hypothetical protein FRC03_001471, partial [Tulasnella sp. 419]